MIDEARKEGKTVHFASLMDICHLKNSEWEPHFQKYKGRVVLRGNIVKEISGSYAVFTEQGSSVSQMTAAKVMDVISRLPGCAGQAADAVSAFSQVKMEDAPTLLKIPKSWSSMEDPVVCLVRSSCGRTIVGKAIPDIVGKKGMFFVNREKGLFSSVYVDHIKLAGKKQNICPTWKILMKHVDLGEPTTFLDHVYLGCTQRECQLWIITEICSNSEFLLEPTKNYQPELQGNLMPKQYLHGPMTWKVMQRNGGKILRTCE